MRSDNYYAKLEKEIPSAERIRAKIEQDMAAFIRAGGKITELPSCAFSRSVMDEPSWSDKSAGMTYSPKRPDAFKAMVTDDGEPRV